MRNREKEGRFLSPAVEKKREGRRLVAWSWWCAGVTGGMERSSVVVDE